MDDTEITEQDMKRTIDDIIRNQLNLRGDEKILPNVDLVRNYNADSLDIMCIVMNIETEFDLYIKDEECGDLQTVQDIYDFVKIKLQLKRD